MTKKLYRSRKEKMIAGVAGGLAEYFDIDPTLIRIIFVVSLFVGGSGILAYIILWIVVPEEPFVFQQPDSSSRANREQQNSTNSQNDYQAAEKMNREKHRNFAGGILIVLGVLFLANNVVPHFRFGDFWPIIIIAIGIGVLLKSNNN